MSIGVSDSTKTSRAITALVSNPFRTAARAASTAAMYVSTATPSRTSKCALLDLEATWSSGGIGASSITVTHVSPSRVLQNVMVGRMKSASRDVSNGIDPNMIGPTPIGRSVEDCSISLRMLRASAAFVRALMPRAAKPMPWRTKRNPFAPAMSLRSISRSVMCASGKDVAFMKCCYRFVACINCVSPPESCSCRTCSKPASCNMSTSWAGAGKYATLFGK